MELYGNINSLAKSIFEFDKIYENYTEALSKATKDGVLINRYVLVNYSKIDKEERLYNLAVDNGYDVKENSNPSYQQIIDYCRKNNKDLADYDNSILIKTSDNTYQIVMNFKLTSAEQERKEGANFRDNSIQLYSDYIKIMSEFFGYNGISTQEIDRVWTDNFNWKDAVVSYNGQDNDSPLEIYNPPMEGLGFKDMGTLGSDSNNLDNYYPLYVNEITNIELNNEIINNIEKYYIYIHFSNGNNNARKLYRGECISFTDTPEDGIVGTLQFKSYLMSFAKDEFKNPVGISLVRRPDHEVIIDTVGSDIIEQLWHQGEVTRFGVEEGDNQS